MAKVLILVALARGAQGFYLPGGDPYPYVEGET
ncbi:hypothetical protein THAOC_30308, partial [Thalassiosira oceanica]